MATPATHPRSSTTRSRSRSSSRSPSNATGTGSFRLATARRRSSAFGESDVDLVVLDLALPKLDGLEVCRRLRAAEHRPDHHAHRARRRDRQGSRARARRRRLHHEAVLDPRVPEPRARALRRRAQLAPAAEPDDVIEADGVRDRPRRGASSPCAASRCSSPTSSSSCCARSPPLPAGSSRARRFSRRSGAAPTTATRGRSTSTCATCARRSSATRASRSYIFTVRGVGLSLPGGRCERPPLRSLSLEDRLRPLRPRGRARWAIVYLAVVPRLEYRLVDAKIGELERRQCPPSAQSLRARIRAGTRPPTRTLVAISPRASMRAWSSYRLSRGRSDRGRRLERSARRTSSATLSRSQALEEAAGDSSGRVTRGSRSSPRRRCRPTREASCSSPPRSATPSRTSASSRGACSWPGLSRCSSPAVAGYFAAWGLTRRLRRLERAADRIAAGDFEQPVVDTGADEVAQLAARSTRMRERLAAPGPRPP